MWIEVIDSGSSWNFSKGLLFLSLKVFNIDAIQFVPLLISFLAEEVLLNPEFAIVLIEPDLDL